MLPHSAFFVFFIFLPTALPQFLGERFRRLGECCLHARGVLAARLRDVRSAAAAAADERRNRLDELAGIGALLFRCLADHDEEVYLRLIRTCEHGHAALGLLEQTVAEVPELVHLNLCERGREELHALHFPHFFARIRRGIPREIGAKFLVLLLALAEFLLQLLNALRQFRAVGL